MRIFGQEICLTRSNMNVKVENCYKRLKRNSAECKDCEFYWSMCKRVEKRVNKNVQK